MADGTGELIAVQYVLIKSTRMEDRAEDYQLFWSHRDAEYVFVISGDNLADISVFMEILSQSLSEMPECADQQNIEGMGYGSIGGLST